MTSNELLNQPVEQIREYWQTVQQRKWLIYFTTLALTLAAVVTIALLHDQYQATTTILVDPQKVPDEYVNATIRSPLTERLQTISQEVLSSTRLQEVIDKWNLYPELRQSMSMEQIIDYMRNKIKIDVKRAAGSGPGAFSITYEGRNPVVVAQVTNELASRFIEWNLQTRQQQAMGTTQFLSGQLQGAKRDLENQEGQVRGFKMQHLGEMPEQVPANLGTLAQLRAQQQSTNDALNRLEQERIELQRLPEMAGRYGRTPAPATERARLEDEKMRLEGQLFELRRRYTPAHPEVVDAQARLERVNHQLRALPTSQADGARSEADNSPAGVRLEIIAREMKRLEEDQKRLQLQIAAYQAKLDAVPLREQQYVDITRDYDVSKDKYRSLLQKKFSAEMAADLERKQQAERFTVLDPARPPEKPVKPNRKMLFAGAFLASLVLSLGLVLLKETLDTTIKAERHLSGMVPDSVVMLASIPTIVTPGTQRRRRRFTAIALATSAIACLLVAAFLWKVHPIL
jgi:succinoglycan biosynthesis transport protein ExoP